MVKKHVVDRVAERLRGEMNRNAERVARVLAFPKEGVEGTSEPKGRFIEDVRMLSLGDPNYLTEMLDRLAPGIVPLADGTMLRSEAGLDSYLELVAEARPEIYLQAVMMGQDR